MQCETKSRAPGTFLSWSDFYSCGLCIFGVVQLEASSNKMLAPLQLLLKVAQQTLPHTFAVAHVHASRRVFRARPLNGKFTGKVRQNCCAFILTFDLDVLACSRAQRKSWNRYPSNQ